MSGELVLAGDNPEGVREVPINDEHFHSLVEAVCDYADVSKFECFSRGDERCVVILVRDRDVVEKVMFTKDILGKPWDDIATWFCDQVLDLSANAGAKQ